MKRGRRSCVFAGVAIFLVRTAILGQAREEQRPQPPTWKRANERKVAIPAGTMLTVRLIDRLSSDKSQAGDRFEVTLDTPIVVGGTVVAEKGASVVGRVVRARKAGRMTAPSELVLELVELVGPWDGVTIETDPIERSGEASSAGGDAVAIGSTAALGTALGTIFGRGKGAAIGAAAGGAVGAGGTLSAKGKPAAVKSEAVLVFRLRAPATVTVHQEKEPQP